MDQFFQGALKAAQAGKGVLLKHWGATALAKSQEKAPADLVSEADYESERAIKKVLMETFPDHGFWGEEGELSQGEYLWVVDPLDGSNNFLYGYPWWSLSLALMHQREVLLGLIVDPLRNDWFYAIKGKGAYHNGMPMKPWVPTDTASCLLATGFPFKYKDKLGAYLKVFQEIFTRVRGIRRAGSAALDLAYTAKGVFQGFFELGLKPWDIAAGILMVKEVGGRVGDWGGKPDFWESGNIWAGYSPMYEELLPFFKL